MKPYTLTPSQVRAAQEGRLRLLIVPLEVDPEAYPYCGSIDERDGGLWISFWDEDHIARHDQGLPYTVGDRLWCREEYTLTVPKRRVIYGAGHKSHDDVLWSSPDTMPQWASHFTLEVVAVTVKRLQDVTEEEARLAGRAPIQFDPDPWPGDWDDNPWCAYVEVKRCD